MRQKNTDAGMFSYFRLLFLIVFTFILTGCGGGYAITYNTYPTGADIVCNGISKGYSPVTLYYDFTDNNYRTQPCKAVWISGAQNFYQNEWSEEVIRFPQGVMSTLQRPEYPGLEKDMQFAFQVEQMKYAREPIIIENSNQVNVQSVPHSNSIYIPYIPYH